MTRHVYIHLDFDNRPLDELDPQERYVAEKLDLALTYHGRDRGPSAMRYFVDNRIPRVDLSSEMLTRALVARIMRPRVTAEVPVSEIKTIQDWLRPTQVMKALLGLSIGTPPNVIKVNRDYVLLDGNHRVTAALMNGDPTILVSLDDGEIN